MDEEKKDALSPEANSDEPGKEPYTPASKGKRIAAWIGVVFMVFLIIMYTYSLANGTFLNW